MGAQTKAIQQTTTDQANDISSADHYSTQYWAACYSILETAGHAMSCDLRPVRTATLFLAVQIVCFTSRL